MAMGQFPDLHHKMSKKIAQLTKVIYTLNSKNEDQRELMTGIKDAYETEIDGLLKDVYERINGFHNQLDVQKQHTDFEEQLKTYQAQREQERKEALAQFASSNE